MAKKFRDELMNHEIDGIREFDNDLPPWWLNMFYFTIVFAVVYYGYYHFSGKGEDQLQRYAAEVKAAEEFLKTLPGGGDPLFNAVVAKDQETITKGAGVFNVNCAPCHGQNAQGDVGPNLTDEYWIHGPKFADILRTIRNGVPDKGMVTWEGVLKPEEMLQVASYVVSLQGNKPENPKDPQGDKYESSEVGR